MAAAAFSIATSTSRVCNYLLSGSAHDDSGDRRYAYAGGVGGMIPSIAAGQFAAIRRRYGKQDTKRQGVTGYISFSRAELDSNDPDAGIKALKLGKESIARLYPGHPGICVVQRDGKSGLWHVHFLVSAISDRDAEHVFRRKPKKGEPFDADGLVEQREQRKAGRSLSSAMTNAWRLARIVDSVLADEAFMASAGMTAYDNEALMEERRRDNAQRVTSAEQVERDAGNDWRADLREAVAAAQAEATSLEAFRDALAVRRVELRVRKGKFGVDFGNGIPVNFSYSLHDVDGKLRNARAGGRDGIGDECGSAATLACVEWNQRNAEALAEPAPDSLQVRLASLSARERRRLIGSVILIPSLAKIGQRVGSTHQMTMNDPTLRLEDAAFAIAAWEAAGEPETFAERLVREQAAEGQLALGAVEPAEVTIASEINVEPVKPDRLVFVALQAALEPPPTADGEEALETMRPKARVRKARTPAHLRYLKERSPQIARDKELGE